MAASTDAPETRAARTSDDVFSAFSYAPARDRLLRGNALEHYQEGVALLSMPVEVLLQVLGILDPPDIAHMAASCRMMACLLRRDIADVVWRAVHGRSFGGRSSSSTYKADCIKMFKHARLLQRMVMWAEQARGHQMSRKQWRASGRSRKEVMLLDVAFAGDHVRLAERCFEALGELFSPVSPTPLLFGGTVLPLRAAAKYKSPQVVRLLLLMGADVHQRMEGVDDGRSAFVAMVAADMHSMVQLLRGPALRELDVLQDVERQEITLAAIGAGNTELLHELYARGGTPSDHGAALERAIASKCNETIEFVANHIPRGAVTIDMIPRFRVWIRQDCAVETLSLLCDREAFSSSCWPSIWTAASRCGRVDVLDMMMNRGVPLSFENVATLLKSGHHDLEMFERSLSLLPKEPSTEEYAMLMVEACWAWLSSYSEDDGIPLLQYLLRKGVDVNAHATLPRIIATCTPLLAAVEIGMASRVRFLLEHGADPNSRSRAVPGRMVGFGDAFLPGATPDSTPTLRALLSATVEDLPEVLEQLLECGGDLTARDGEGHAAFHFFLAGDSFDVQDEQQQKVLNLIQSSGVDINAVTHTAKQTAVEMAAGGVWGRRMIVDDLLFLVDHYGANLNAFGDLPIFAHYVFEGTSALERLLEAGADFSYSGEVARRIWERVPDDDTTSFLVEHGLEPRVPS